MKYLKIIISFLFKLVFIAKAVKKYWKDGGYTKINVSLINYGGILKGKHILITGGSSGIGLAIAKKCLSEGALVLITGRDDKKLLAIKHEINSPMLKTLVWDVSNISMLKNKLADALNLIGGKIDVLVNNAGILGGHRHFLDTTETIWDQIVSVNEKGLFFLTQHIVRYLLGTKQKGKIINISSMRGNLGVKDGPYGMSKWSINGLTHGLGLILAPQGIIVNGIAPGIIDTDSIAIKNINTQENAYLTGIPVSRIGLPDEIAELAVFLMSDSANYIVGQTIICDGGYSLKV